MKKLLVFIIITAGLLSTSCSTEPEKINYGSDTCHFCTMNIVDKQYAAQYVTKKGKQYKYDAIECMLNELSETGTEKIGVIQVSDYTKPGDMTNAIEATYLISKEIKSPMGANLSAFSKEVSANEFVKIDDDSLFTWTMIKEKFSVK